MISHDAPPTQSMSTYWYSYCGQKVRSWWQMSLQYLLLRGYSHNSVVSHISGRYRRHCPSREARSFPRWQRFRTLHNLVHHWFLPCRLHLLLPHILLSDAKATFKAAHVHWLAQSPPWALELAQESASLYQRVVDTPLHASVSLCLDLTAVILFQAQEPKTLLWRMRWSPPFRPRHQILPASRRCNLSPVRAWSSRAPNET